MAEIETIDAPPDWRTAVPEEFREIDFVKNAKDLPTFVKQAVDAHKEIGARVRIPGKDARPEDVAAFKQRITEAGLLPVPPKSAEEYGITKPETMPEGLAWNDELAGEFSSTLLKHGASKELAQDMLKLYEKALMGTSQVLNTSFDQGMAALRAEHGEKFDEKAAVAGRLANSIFGPEEMAILEASGAANHPRFLSALMRLAPLAEADSTFMASIARAGGEMTGDEVRSELAKIMSDPNHPMHKGYWARDKTVEAHVDELYKKAYGNAKVELH